jgi:nitroimidazol reductase NimA-like FMN-containing flavoprotein (pyridoxamine 5'-phosphate oxidase superfamily)
VKARPGANEPEPLAGGQPVRMRRQLETGEPPQLVGLCPDGALELGHAGAGYAATMTDEPDLVATARAVVDQNRFMALGTADEGGAPWVSPVWYATADYREFLWVSDPDARHSRNIAARPQVSVVIFDSHATGTWTSVYMSALAEELQGRELDRGIELFSRRSIEDGFGTWGREDVQPPARRRLYRATASEHFVLGPEDRRLRVTVE